MEADYCVGPEIEPRFLGRSAHDPVTPNELSRLPQLQHFWQPRSIKSRMGEGDRTAWHTGTGYRVMQFVQRLWGRYKWTDKTETTVTWNFLILWPTKSKAITTGNLTPLVVPLRSRPSALCHSVFRQRHYLSHLSSMSYHSPTFIPISSSFPTPIKRCVQFPEIGFFSTTLSSIYFSFSLPHFHIH
jgi:hypothetical protein